ncbi:glycosyltransferase family 2 protein [Ottowia sp.]|uniref:glycosyltransferase family 2 protein n=1 Tax=Ottowia sp. TaxID=1898956 RepID=UPI002B6D650A|nr:glycosyltransferase family 2 protein [Ottowia sp.]HOB65754.1 glycosyltransferase family 2 protein [Ottowia sp.]HPZ57534.1 glycosyltransferase family 2 protein [Ottowia sp.]HQD48963.1 glycosyltransferase family 2 protein [Ottowia sp.]
MPAYNEAASLPRVVPEVLAALRALSPAVELIVVDDGSRDDTVAVVSALQQQHPQLVLLQLSRNFGKEAALSAGLDHARGDAVFIMDSDGQHPVALLPRMLQAWQQGAEVVYAVRRTRDDQTALHRKLAGAFYGLVNWGARVKVPADAGDFRLMDARVVRALRELPEQHRFMKGLYAWVGFRSLALDYEPLPRQAGHSHYGLRGAFRLGTTGLLAFSAAPLRLMGLVGVLLALAALGYGLWVVGEYFVLGIVVPGYATIVVGMMFLAGVQLMAVGLLSEYVARIYDEVKRRPLYLVARRTGQGLPADPNA